MRTKRKNVSLPVMKPLSCWLKTVLPVLLTGGALLPHQAMADNYYFDPTLLETAKSGQSASDLSAFSGKNTHAPGEYDVEIVINEKKTGRKKITFILDDSGQLQPQLTIGLLRELGFKVDEIESLNTLDDSALVADLSKSVPGSTTKIALNQNRIILNIPQLFLLHAPSGYVDPARWDNGIPVLFTNYSFSGSNSHYSSGENNERMYLNMQNGVNIGPWRLRNYSTWTHSSDQNRWDSINTWLQRDIKVLKSQFVLGESATDGAVFSSVQFTGARLYSDQNMLPNSLRGFAPTIRGIANTSAIVTVRQNGYTIYQSNVPAGAFEINDLYPSSFSGDLEVTIEEADGSIRRFTQPFSALPVMQRPGHISYSMTAGRFRADPSSDSKEPEFIESTAFYGLNNIFTLYGGVTGSKDYQAVALGIGSTLGILGALSTDYTYAKTQLENSEKFSGEGLRFQYIKDIPETETSISLSYSRYTNAGFFTFADANQRDIDVNNHQRSEAVFNINQTLTDSLSFYISGTQREYWGDEQRDRNLSVGLNGYLAGISYSVSGQFTDYADRDSDRAIFISMSVPLDRWLPDAQATFRVTDEKYRSTQYEAGVTGSFLDDNRLSYSLRQRMSEDDSNNGSTLSGSYRSAYGTLNASYDYSSNSRQYSYGLSGGIVAHPHGVTLSQPLGNSFALIDAKGASNIRIKNYPGIATDYFGYAVIPYLTAYQENRISLDTTTMPDNVDVQETAKIVVPGQGAAVIADFNTQIGHRVLLALTDAQGKPIPFGAVASNEGQFQQSIVDEAGIIYLSGINTQPQTWKVRWGNEISQQCQFTFSLNDKTQITATVIRDSAKCL